MVDPEDCFPATVYGFWQGLISRCSTVANACLFLSIVNGSSLSVMMHCTMWSTVLSTAYGACVISLILAWYPRLCFSLAIAGVNLAILCPTQP